MTDTIQITLPDGSVRSHPAGTTARAIAQDIGPRLAKAAVAVKVDGEVRDLDRPPHPAALRRARLGAGGH
jgi:threonyl-tRNA synthetase